MNSQKALTRCALGAAMAMALAPAALASGTTTWEMNSYADFIRGRFEGVSLSRDGRLSLAPRVESVLASDQPAVWAMAQGPDGAVYAATGHRGRVYKIDRAGKSSLLWTAGQPEIFAIAVDRQGAVYAGTSPDGAVYRIQNGTATEYYAPGCRYILSLAVGADGALYVGTGDQGKIFRVASAGKGELYYETGQAHVTSLAVDAQSRLLAGTEPNGILYRVTEKGKATALYNSALPEIRAIVPMADGTVYAAAMGGAAAKRDQSSQSGSGGGSGNNLPTVYTSITVEAQEGGLKQPPDPAKPPLPQPLPAASQSSEARGSAQAGEGGNGDKSAIYRINPDGSVETLWSSKEENAYDLAALNQQVLFATDGDGRIYGIAPDRALSLVAQTKQGEVTRLLASERSVLAATSDMGRVFRLGEAAGQSGSYESPVHDVANVARWGNLSWRAEAAEGCKAAFRTRTGNSARPDQTWSEWSAPLTDAAGSRITSSTARYIQWKVEMSGPGGATPLLAGVTVAYLPRNSAPVIKNLSVVSQSAAAAQPKAAAAVVVGDTDTGGASGAAGATATQTLPKASNNQIVIAWQAEDADGDRLSYKLYFRAEDEREWKLLKGDLHEASATFDADLFADGRYYFRVAASDAEVNPPATARETVLTSTPVLIDNTPPVVTTGAVRRNGAQAHVEFEAVDAASQLRRCEYSVDAAPWVPVEAADGVIDGMREKFTLDLTGLAAGERLVVVRVADSAGNTGVAKTVLK
jgi:hypothetical protein